MVIDVIGYQAVSFDDQKTGRHIEGVNVHFLSPLSGKACEGSQGVKKFVGSDKIQGPIGLGKANIEFSLGTNDKAVITSFSMIK